MGEPSPLPDFPNEVRGISPQQMLFEEMEYIVEEMYNFLPNVDLPDDIRLKLMDMYTKDLENFKYRPDYFQTWIDNYERKTNEKKKKNLRPRIPEVITDQNRIERMYEYAEVAKRRMLEDDYPLYLRLTIQHCLEMLSFNLKRKAVKCTRNMWRAVKTILLGTEKENKHDGKFLVMLGILNLKEAVAAEFARARAK